MTEEKKYTVGEILPWPEWYEIERSPDLDTEHLPDEVVRQEFTFMIAMRTTKEDPRRGTMNWGLNLGGDINRSITSQEREYLVRCFEGALRCMEDKT